MGKIKVNFPQLGRLLDLEEQKHIIGGMSASGANCFLRCNQDETTGHSVSSCSRDVAMSYCGGDLSRAVCVCCGNSESSDIALSLI